MHIHSSLLLTACLLIAIAGCEQGSKSNDQGEGIVPNSNEEKSFAEFEFEGEKLILVPSSRSKTRVQQTGLPAEGSENVRHLLVLPVEAEDMPEDDSGIDYRPDDAIDWIADIEFEGAPILQRKTILEIFDTEWFQLHGKPEIYGWSPEEKRWTYLRAGGVPETYTKLTFGWSLFDPIAEEDFTITVEDLNSYKASVSRAAQQLGNAELRWNRSAEDAARLAETIRSVVAQCNRDVTVVLATPTGKSFSGRDIWDVMLCLGLEWGDMDIFHWQNPNRSVGDDFLFSVWTSTPPGYFFPERIAAGKVQVQDLAFGYSVPRSADPVAVFESMMKAVRYSQKRLGGELLDAEGRPFDEANASQEIKDTVKRLNDAGFVPGKNSTLRVF